MTLSGTVQVNSEATGAIAVIRSSSYLLPMEDDDQQFV